MDTAVVILGTIVTVLILEAVTIPLVIAAVRNIGRGFEDALEGGTERIAEIFDTSELIEELRSSGEDSMSRITKQQEGLSEAIAALDYLRSELAGDYARYLSLAREARELAQTADARALEADALANLRAEQIAALRKEVTGELERKLAEQMKEQAAESKKLQFRTAWIFLGLGFITGTVPSILISFYLA